MTTGNCLPLGENFEPSARVLSFPAKTHSLVLGLAICPVTLKQQSSLRFKFLPSPSIPFKTFVVMRVLISLPISDEFAVGDPKHGCDSTGKGDGQTLALPSEDVIFGRSAAMQPIRQMVAKVLATDLPVLIQGENGTGKGLLAQYIHAQFALRLRRLASRLTAPRFLARSLKANSSATKRAPSPMPIPPSPATSNSPTTARLFLDEISDLDMSLQAKTLQLLQDGTYSRIGDTQERRSTTRIICATNRNLVDEIAAGRFRQDLFYRINVVTLNLPPLRERREDIPLSPTTSSPTSKRNSSAKYPHFPKKCSRAFTHQEWRGNIRELENLVARYAILGGLDPLRRTGVGSVRRSPH